MKNTLDLNLTLASIITLYLTGGAGKCKSLEKKGLPIVAVATTSGTGSEMNGFGVISNLETKEKIGFGHPALTPVLAVVDPELMTTVPAMLMCDKVTHKNLIDRPPTIPNFIIRKKQNKHNRLLCFFRIPS